MRVKLGIARWKARQEAEHVSLVHPRILQQPEHSVRVPDASPLKRRPGARAKAVEDHRMHSAIYQVAPRQAEVQAERVPRQTHPLDAQLRRILHQNTEHPWVQMQMQM